MTVTGFEIARTVFCNSTKTYHSDVAVQRESGVTWLHCMAELPADVDPQVLRCALLGDALRQMKRMPEIRLSDQLKLLATEIDRAG
ncbi:hypothetical protein [Chachezhania antarctica]|uniref:hypothetical protein n=1 Tax=Chachezhania antarctica TaxID=2340860 RepID=UPI000EABEA81|nr:hypothetical protein [Chachezhania antarctica]